jgi:L,D-transpeptidase catalytic domain
MHWKLGALTGTLLTVAVVLVAPATSAAGGTRPTAATTTTKTTPAKATPPPAAVPRASATLYLPHFWVLAHHVVTVPDRRIEIDGVVRPYVPGQWVMVRAFIGRRQIRHARLRIMPSPNRTRGRFSEVMSIPSAGDVVVSATHHRTRQLGGFEAHRRFAALDERVGPGSAGRFVQLVQQRLAALHFYLPQSGVYDNGTELALDAYHRLLGWGTYNTLDGRTISFLLNGWGEFKVRFPNHGRHAEGNLSKQVLALIDGAKVDFIFPISSGKPSTPTILGNFHIYQRTPGYLPDGMYYSDFFIGGYAIHGYDPAPDYPASHGCMRLPIPDAKTAYHWLTYGDWVDVYY